MSSTTAQKRYSLFGSPRAISRHLQGGQGAFHGEMMTCLMCGAKQFSHPKHATDWRALEVDGVRFYACPKHFPPDGASVAEFSKAYEELIFKAVLAKGGG